VNTRGFQPFVILGVLVASGLLLSSCASGNSENSASPGVPTPSEELAVQTATPESPEETTEAPDGPLYIGNDASFDFLVAIRDNVPLRWRIDKDALPTKQEVSRSVLTEMVSPERCAQVASLAEVGYLVEEGPLQFIFDGDFQDDADDFVVVGQAPLGILDEVTSVIPQCATFAISRQSPSVVNNSPTQDVVTYQVESKILQNGYMFIQFTADGVVQMTDKNYACLSQGNGDCMFKRSALGYRLIRQDGETLIVTGVTNIKSKAGSAARPMKVNEFLNDAQSILDSFDDLP
jgi:hypothetical protein